MTEETKDAIVYASASALGIVAGMRAMTAPAVVGYIANSGCLGVPSSAFGALGSPATKTVLNVMAAGEFITDKLPFTPNRTETFPLLGRIASGAVCGAAICSAKGRSKFLGAFAGAIGALGGTFAAFYLREAVAQKVPGTLVAIAEDGAAVWAGKAICQSLARTA